MVTAVAKHGGQVPQAQAPASQFLQDPRETCPVPGQSEADL